LKKRIKGKGAKKSRTLKKEQEKKESEKKQFRSACIL